MPENKASEDRAPSKGRPDHSIFDKIVSEARYTAIKVLVKTGRVTESTMTADDLNNLLDKQLPETFSIRDSTGGGELIVQSALLTMPEDSNCFSVNLSCSLKIAVLGNQVYEASLTASLTAEPDYQKSTKKIRLKNGSLKKITVLKDELTMIQQVQSSAEDLVPEAFRGLLKSSIETAVSMFDAFSSTNTKGNIEQIKNESRQNFLDFHHKEIEEHLLSLLEDENAYYQIDNTDTESRIFIELGSSVSVKDGRLHFRFEK
jgi:hypothetical protein